MAIADPPTRVSTAATASQFLRWAIWFGLMVGIAEVAIVAVRKFVLGAVVGQPNSVIGHDWHLVWMAPLAAQIEFLSLGILLFLLAGRWPVSPRTAGWVLAFPAFLILLIERPLSRTAALLLAAGLATVFARVIVRFHVEFNQLVRRTTLWLVAWVLGSTAVVCGSVRFTEYQALAQLPPAPANAPNVLLITLDTVRAANLSLYGYARRTTPQLERLAAGGVRFDRAVATAPWTLPSHASMFTGRFPHELSTGSMSALDGTFPTLAEVLAARGYETAGFVANTAYCSRDFGLSRGFIHYEDHPVSPGKVAFSSALGRYLSASHRLRNLVGYHELLDRKPAATVNEGFLSWLSRPRQRPFFAFLNYCDAHEPYLPPEPFNVKFGPARPPHGSWPSSQRGTLNMLNSGWQLTPEEVQVEIDAYDGAIASLDHELGVLFDELTRRGVMGNTLIIVTSDHGEHFGEHGLYSHGNSLYMPLLHVPLVISCPGLVPSGKTVAEAVSLRELPATVVDLLNGMDRERFPGRSLRRHWDAAPHTDKTRDEVQLSEVDARAVVCKCGSAAHFEIVSEVEAASQTSLPAWYPSSQGALQSLVAGTKHYIRNADGREELYDLAKDPLEQQDLAGRVDCRELLDQLRKSLAGKVTRDR